MGTLLAFILMCQAGMDDSAAMPIPSFQDEDPAAQAANEERGLMHRYNALARALSDFIAAYKAGKVDLKKAKAVRKALHDLEKFEWFRPWHTTSAPGLLSHRPAVMI
jgi:hypothetical protein